MRLVFVFAVSSTSTTLSSSPFRVCFVSFYNNFCHVGNTWLDFFALDRSMCCFCRCNNYLDVFKSLSEPNKSDWCVYRECWVGEELNWLMMLCYGSTPFLFVAFALIWYHERHGAMHAYKANSYGAMPNKRKSLVFFRFILLWTQTMRNNKVSSHWVDAFRIGLMTFTVCL